MAFTKFDYITSSIEKFGDIDSMALEEAIESLEIQAKKLQYCKMRREEKVLLARAM